MYKNKDTGIYYVDVAFTDGIRIRKSTGTKKLDQARRLHDVLKYHIFRNLQSKNTINKQKVISEFIKIRNEINSKNKLIKEHLKKEKHMKR